MHLLEYLSFKKSVSVISDCFLLNPKQMLKQEVKFYIPLFSIIFELNINGNIFFT